MDGGVLISRILKLDYRQGQAVYEDHDVRAPVLALYDSELVDGQELVVLWVHEVHQTSVVASNGAVLALVFHGYAVDEHVVESTIVGQERWGLCVGDFAKDFFQDFGWDRGIKTAEGIMEAASKEYLLEGLALGSGLAGSDVGTEDGGVAEG